MAFEKLNPFQIVCCKQYGGGDYAYIAEPDIEATHNTGRLVNNCGDTLFVFLMRELMSLDEPMTADIAVGRLERAKEDIETVLKYIRVATS